MSERNQHYPDLEGALSNLVRRYGWKWKDLAAAVNERDYEITRIKQGTAAVTKQRQFIRKLLNLDRLELLPEEIEFFELYAQWCEDRDDGVTTESWEDYWYSRQETSEHTHSQRDKQIFSEPLQKLQPAPHFVGRETEIQQVLNYLQPGHIVTLVGPAGIGKTQIAAKVVERLAPSDGASERFPDGIVFYSFYGEHKSKAESALSHILASFGREPRPPYEELALDVLTKRHALLILDGAECADDLMRVLDARGKHCGVLITSQSRKDIKEHGVKVDALPFKAADELLLALGGDNAGNKRARKRIYHLVDGVTLAIELVGSYLREQPEESIEEYIAWLEERPLEALNFGKHRRESVPVLIERSVSRVSERAQAVLAVLGALAFTPIALSILTAALDVQGIDLKRPLQNLVNYSLLLKEGNRYKVHHFLIYDYIKKHLTASTDAVSRLATYYTKLIDEQGKLDQEEKGLFEISAEPEHLFAVLAECLNQKKWNEIQSITQAGNWSLIIRHDWPIGIVACRAGIEAARAMKNSQLEKEYLKCLSVVYRRMGRYEQAIECCEQAVTIAKQIGDPGMVASCLAALGGTYWELMQLEKAIECYKQALFFSKESGNPLLEAASLNELGSIYRDIGQYQQAIECYEQGLAIVNTAGNVIIEDILRSNLAVLYSHYQANFPQGIIVDPKVERTTMFDLSQSAEEKHGISQILKKIDQIFPLREDRDK